MALPSETDLLTTAEAAEVLGVSPVTVSRWIKQGRLPGYRLGPRALRVRRGDLSRAMRPVVGRGADQEEAPTLSWDPDRGVDEDLIASIKPMTEEEKERALAALRRAQENRQKMLTERGGQPLPESWPLIREAREERARQIAGE